MDKEKKKQFSIRITQSNRTSLIAIEYEILDVYLEDALKARENNDREGFKMNLRWADNVLKELISVLDFSYDISAYLYRLYMWCREQLALSISLYSTDGIEEAKKVLDKLGKAFHELAEKDDSQPEMKNVQKVSYGMTYGRQDITESVVPEANRGFLA